jgi:hypothetical protein
MGAEYETTNYSCNHLKFWCDNEKELFSSGIYQKRTFYCASYLCSIDLPGNSCYQPSQGDSEDEREYIVCRSET